MEQSLGINQSWWWIKILLGFFITFITITINSDWFKQIHVTVIIGFPENKSDMYFLMIDNFTITLTHKSKVLHQTNICHTWLFDIKIFFELLRKVIKKAHVQILRIYKYLILYKDSSKIIMIILAFLLQFEKSRRCCWKTCWRYCIVICS